jgi:UDP-glucose 4-epimerase
MTILVIGGAGYIGSHTSFLLHEQGYEVIILDDLSTGYKEALLPEAIFYEGDFGDINLLNKIFTTHKIDAIMHFAAKASVPDSVVNPMKYYDTNVSRLQRLLDTCVEHKIFNFIFSSSAAVYGESEKQPLDEDIDLIPINPYGRTKLIGELMLQDYSKAYGINYCAFRYFCAAGDSNKYPIGEAHRPEDHLIPKTIQKALRGENGIVFGNQYDTKDGTCVRDFVHVEDIAMAHILGLRYIQNGNPSDSFNLGSGEGYSVLEIMKTLQNYLDFSYSIAAPREGDPAMLIATNYKAKEKLSWSPDASSLDNILSSAIHWEKTRKY